MDAKIALPDTYASPEALQRVLNAQGYELARRDSVFGIDVQHVRLIDVFFIAPVLIYAGFQPSLPKALRVTLVVLGVATIIYNGHHYLINNKK